MQWTFSRYQLTSVIPTSSSTWRNVETFFSIAEPQRRAAKHLGHTWYIGKCFSKNQRLPVASSTAPFTQELNPWISCVSEHTSPHVTSESQTPVPKNYGADQQRLQISDFHFDKFPTPATFVCWKIRFKTEACSCSQFLTEAMQWIKEVELVYSVDELRSSSSTRGISMPNFEVLDERIASALNKIIHHSYFKRKISLEEQKAQKQDRFFRDRLFTWSTSISGSLGAMILPKTTPICSLLFLEMTIFRNSIQSGTEFYCPWRKIPHDDI